MKDVRTNKEIEDIQLPKLIEICQKYMDNKISQEELENWCNTKIYIKFYLPIAEKSLCIYNILLEQLYNDDVAVKISQLEMYKFWYILLQYTNISIQGYDKLLTFDNYDLCYSIIGDFIYSRVKLDYDRTNDMVVNALHIENLNMLIETINNLNNIDIEKLSQVDKNLYDFIDKHPEDIKNMIALMAINNPQGNELMKTLMKK